MTAKSKSKKRRLPKDIMERPDREAMTILFGKRIMKELDKVTGYDEKADPQNRVGG